MRKMMLMMMMMLLLVRLFLPLLWSPLTESSRRY